VSGVSGWLRWPRGFSCPGCGSGGCWWTGTGLWMCADCGLKTSATAGTLHHRISRQHLPYYLDDFTFRFNRRTSRSRGLLFYRLVQQAAGTDPHPLSELIRGTGNDWAELTND
jgi:hypothetical protein